MAIIVGVLLVSASGAGATTPQHVTRIDVSTRAAVVQYLRAIHVNAKHVVIQRGLRNYAGAQCPGKGWTCAGTRHTVVQIAKRGGLNRFACASAKCAVVQFGGVSHRLHALAFSLKAPVNTASCIKTTGITGSCTINQPNATGTNQAVVWMDTGKDTGLTQTANWTASITQGPASAGTSSNDNLACVHQFVSIDGSATKTNGANVTVNNNAYQSAKITQNSVSGNNSVQGAVRNGTRNFTYACDPNASSSMTQSETLTSTVTTKGSITQNEDATANGPNLNVDIEQNQSSGFKCQTVPSLSCPASGTNTANFQQTINQTAIANKTTTTGSVSQTQSSPDDTFPFSGGVGTLNQDSSGPSTSNATQNETQCEDALNTGTDPNPLKTCDQKDQDVPGYSLTQTQYGPEGVFKAPAHSNGPAPYYHKGYGTATLTGNAHDHIGITQTSQQDNDTFAGQHNTLEADCSTPQVPADAVPPGCTVHQSTLIDGNTTSNDDSGSDLGGVGITCTPGESGSDCTQSPPPGPICNAGDTNALYNDMPTDVVNCLNPAIGFQAQQTSEFGDEVGVTTGSTLDSLKVDFQSFACQSGSWDGNPAPCSTDANATFPWPITANIYAVKDCGGTPCQGMLLATTTPTQNILYRPSADTTGHCTGAPNTANASTKWWNPDAIGGGACQNSIGTVLTFNNWTFQNGFDGTLPANVIWTVAFNTSSYGPNPVGPANCQTGPGGCPYDSLNVGDNTLGVFAGTDTDPNGVFINSLNSSNYCGDGATPGTLALATPCWTPYAPLGEITGSAPG